MSVENFPFNLGLKNMRSARYLLASGKIADRVPLCRVDLKVPRALFKPMPNRSDSCSAVALVCRSVDTKDGLTGTSANRSSPVLPTCCKNLSPSTIAACTVRHSFIPCMIGSNCLSSASLDLGSSTVSSEGTDTFPSWTVPGLHGTLLVISIWVQVAIS